MSLRNRVSDELLLQTVLENPGATASDIGRILNLSRVQVSKRKNSTEFKSLLNQFQTETIEHLQMGRLKAIRRITQLIDSEDLRVALKASEILLNTANLKKLEYENQKVSEGANLRRIVEALRQAQEKRKALAAQTKELYG